jgi:hypothetical protein
MSTKAIARAKKFRPVEKRIDSQRSWLLRSDCVELAVTRLGAHMAPVRFCLGGRGAVEPYYISPWQNGKPAGLVPVLAPLRGDFFCLPFGSNGEAYRGETHPFHGETSGSLWALDECVRGGCATTLRIRLETKVRPGTVRRAFTLLDGQNVVYCSTMVEGFAGKAPFSHHAILKTEGEAGTLLVSTGKFHLGRTYPVPSADPAGGSYQSLAPDAPFRSLSRVPSIFRNQPPCDCSAFPVRPGFTDLFQQFERPAAGRQAPSWVAAVNIAEGWLWFALKDPALMPGRLFWIENHGLHGAPWNGRNRCLGIEDGRMYFDRGIAQSCRPNPVNRLGIPTAFDFPGSRAVEIRYIQGAARVPRGFGRVVKARFPGGAAVFYSATGESATIPVRHRFLFDGAL